MRSWTHFELPWTNWMFMRSFLWGFSSCTRGWSDCVGSRHFFFLHPTIPYKDSSVTCDLFASSSWGRRLELDLNTIVFFSIFFFYFFIPEPLFSDLDGDTSRGQEIVQQRKPICWCRHELSAVIIQLKENLAYNEVTEVWDDTWIERHLKILLQSVHEGTAISPSFQDSDGFSQAEGNKSERSRTSYGSFTIDFSAASDSYFKNFILRQFCIEHRSLTPFLR